MEDLDDDVLHGRMLEHYDHADMLRSYEFIGVSPAFVRVNGAERPEFSLSTRLGEALDGALMVADSQALREAGALGRDCFRVSYRIVGLSGEGDHLLLSVVGSYCFPTSL